MCINWLIQNSSTATATLLLIQSWQSQKVAYRVEILIPQCTGKTKTCLEINSPLPNFRHDFQTEKPNTCLQLVRDRCPPCKAGAPVRAPTVCFLSIQFSRLKIVPIDY